MGNNIGMFFQALAMIIIMKAILEKWDSKKFAEVVKTAEDIRDFWQAFTWLEERMRPYSAIEDFCEHIQRGNK